MTNLAEDLRLDAEQTEEQKDTVPESGARVRFEQAEKKGDVGELQKIGTELVATDTAAAVQSLEGLRTVASAEVAKAENEIQAVHAANIEAIEHVLPEASEEESLVIGRDQFSAEASVAEKPKVAFDADKYAKTAQVLAEIQEEQAAAPKETSDTLKFPNAMRVLGESSLGETGEEMKNIPMPENDNAPGDPEAVVKKREEHKALQEAMKETEKPTRREQLALAQSQQELEAVERIHERDEILKAISELREKKSGLEKKVAESTARAPEGDVKQFDVDEALAHERVLRELRGTEVALKSQQTRLLEVGGLLLALDKALGKTRGEIAEIDAETAKEQEENKDLEETEIRLEPDRPSVAKTFHPTKLGMAAAGGVMFLAGASAAFSALGRGFKALFDPKKDWVDKLYGFFGWIGNWGTESKNKPKGQG